MSLFSMVIAKSVATDASGLDQLSEQQIAAIYRQTKLYTSVAEGSSSNFANALTQRQETYYDSHEKIMGAVRDMEGYNDEMNSFLNKSNAGVIGEAAMSGVGTALNYAPPLKAAWSVSTNATKFVKDLNEKPSDASFSDATKAGGGLLKSGGAASESLDEISSFQKSGLDAGGNLLGGIADSAKAVDSFSKTDGTREGIEHGVDGVANTMSAVGSFGEVIGKNSPLGVAADVVDTANKTVRAERVYSENEDERERLSNMMNDQISKGIDRANDMTAKGDRAGELGATIERGQDEDLSKFNKILEERFPNIAKNI